MFEWLRAKNKMKRWIFIIILGIVLTSYGMAKVLVMEEMGLNQIPKIVGIFAVGFVAIVYGLISLNRRTLEVFIESTDDRMENSKNININNLIFNKNVFEQGPKIVVIGGGEGLNTVLSGLKGYTSNITAVVTVSSYGEKITKSRKALGLKPTDDIKSSFFALAGTQGDSMEALLNYQFEEGSLKGFDFADIYFSAMQTINKEFGKAITNSNEVFNMIGKVLPATTEEVEISAELENGCVIKEKNKIQEMVSDKFTKINRIKISPTGLRPAKGVLDAISEADAIIIGPGSLYTNVIPNLLVPGVARAIKESAAIKIYISNIMTEQGQTDNYTVSDHLKAIIDHCGKGIVDYCIYDTGEIIPEIIKKYNIEGQDVVEQDIDKTKGVKFLQRSLAVVKEAKIRHDASLIANAVIELVCDDLKYQDKQNDPQYLMLSTKLREDKRINKMKKLAKKKETGKEKTKKEKGQSKFSQKYSDRIKSITESTEKSKKKKIKATEKAKAKAKAKKDVQTTKTSKTAKVTKTEKTRVQKTKTPQQIREEMLKIYKETVKEENKE